MSSDEEPDYMSDDFLAQCIPQDVKPGLKRTHANQRLHEVLKKKEELKEKTSKEPKKTKKEMEEENREEGLQKSLDSSNKGFAMLQKMGYKAGESLGKANVGLKEPISIVVKSNRGGLGRDEVLRQVEEAKCEFRRRKLEEWQRRKKETTPSAEEFRAQKSKQRRLKQVETDLYQSQKACRQLDLAKNFEEPAEKWFWPFQEVASTLEDEEDDEHDARQKVKDAEKDSEIEETSNEEDDHDEAYFQETSSSSSDAKPREDQLDFEEDQPEKTVEPQDFEPDEMLSMLTGYLRSEHLYCFWCGITFSDVEDLNSHCPGGTREDHDD